MPNRPTDTASFGASTINTVTFPALSQTVLSHIVFQTGSGVDNVEISPGASVTVQGTGITGGLAGVGVSSDTTSGPGTLTLLNHAVFGMRSLGVGGRAFFYDQTSAEGISISDSGRIEFHDQSSASGSGVQLYPNNGATPAGVLVFAEQASADGITLLEAEILNNTSGPTVYFNDDCTAYDASLIGIQEVPTTFDLSGHNLPGLTIGRLAVGGAVFLGGNNLSVAPSLDSTFNGSAP